MVRFEFSLCGKTVAADDQKISENTQKKSECHLLISILGQSPRGEPMRRPLEGGIDYLTNSATQVLSQIRPVSSC